MEDLKNRIISGQKADVAHSLTEDNNQRNFYTESGLFVSGNTKFHFTTLNGVIQFIEEKNISELVIINNDIDYISYLYSDEEDHVSVSFDMDNIFNDVLRISETPNNSGIFVLRYSPHIEIQCILKKDFDRSVIILKNHIQQIDITAIQRAKSYLTKGQSVIVTGNIDFISITNTINEVFRNDKLLVINNPFLQSKDILHCNTTLFSEICNVLYSFKNRYILIFNISHGTELSQLMNTSNNILLFAQSDESNKILDTAKVGSRLIKID